MWFEFKERREESVGAGAGVGVGDVRLVLRGAVVSPIKQPLPFIWSVPIGLNHNTKLRSRDINIKNCRTRIG